MKFEDMNSDNDKRDAPPPKPSKSDKSNGGAEPQAVKDQVMILRTEVRQVDKTVDGLVVKVDANRKEAKDDFKTLLAMMTANREEFLAMMAANREEFLAGQKETNARMDAMREEFLAGQKETNARMDAMREEFLAGQKETNARMDAMREEFLAMMAAMREEFLAGQKETNARMDAGQKETNARMDANQRETNARMDANQRETNARIDANRKEIFKVQLLGAVILAVLLMSSPLAGKVLGKFGLAATPSAVRQDVAPPRAEGLAAKAAVSAEARISPAKRGRSLPPPQRGEMSSRSDDRGGSRRRQTPRGRGAGNDRGGH